MLLDRSAIFRRAWQLARWNANPRDPSENRPFGHWLRRAWAEWREHGGAGWDFAPPSPVDAARARVDFLENQDLLSVGGLVALSAARADLSAALSGARL